MVKRESCDRKITDKVKELRKSKGLTQKEFADILGININTVAQAESYRQNYTIKLLRKISEKFNVPMRWFFDEPGDLDDTGVYKILDRFDYKKKTKVKEIVERLDKAEIDDIDVIIQLLDKLTRK
ncbi:helix-turn-helix domain-containing protein [Thermotomaculum hydrothermale]|uniref:helix-turn-helix domain-containing protein n=1 Tax=Thermotomaculum hydrothermale TaxID=981385 RepID=UPI001916ADE9|nr:helix-turn-helix transcriptional regulator [Thermotomaculum hydrothermale]